MLHFTASNYVKYFISNFLHLCVAIIDCFNLVLASIKERVKLWRKCVLK